MRNVGTVVRGIRAPIIKEGDNLEKIVVDSIMAASESDNIEFRNKDILAITESLVARAQGNYITIDTIAKDVHRKFGDEVGVVFPIYSRNRFSLILKGIAKGVKKVYIQFSYPDDEVGNPIMDSESIYSKGINPYSDVFTEEEFKNVFSKEERIHPFTKVDYIDFYKSLSDNIEIVFSNNPTTILDYTKNVLVADIHVRERHKKLISAAGGENVYSLDEIVSEGIDGSKFNPQYGVLGSNYSTDDKLKLFPTDGQNFVNNIQKELWKRTGKQIEVMIYGDGAFKDPVAGIWELADPVVSPAYTDGLNGTPNELKLKFLADNTNLSDEELVKKIKEKNISAKESLGTTPRRIPDLVGSLCDLTSGSGDKGTPIVYIQGYFDNYSND